MTIYPAVFSFQNFSVLFFSNWIDMYPSGVPKMTPNFRSFSHHRRLWKGDVLKQKKWISVRDEWWWEFGRRNLDLLWFERGAKMMILGHMLVANGAMTFVSATRLQDFSHAKNWNWWPEVWCRIGGLCSHFKFKRERSVCDQRNKARGSSSELVTAPKQGHNFWCRGSNMSPHLLITLSVQDRVCRVDVFLYNSAVRISQLLSQVQVQRERVSHIFYYSNCMKLKCPTCPMAVLPVVNSGSPSEGVQRIIPRQVEGVEGF